MVSSRLVSASFLRPDSQTSRASQWFETLPVGSGGLLDFALDIGAVQRHRVSPQSGQRLPSAGRLSSCYLVIMGTPRSAAAIFMFRILDRNCVYYIDHCGVPDAPDCGKP
jgi:hypothetical protein